MEKPEESECALFTQLLAEYDIVPCYTLNPRDLEIIGKMHNIKEEVCSISNNPLNSDVIIKIKQEVEDSSNGGYSDDREDTMEDNGANNDINDVEIKQEIDYNDDMSCAHEGDNDKDNLIDTFHASSNDTEEYETDGGHDIDLENEAKANVHDDRSSGAEDDEQWNMVCVPKMLPMKRQFVFKGPKALIINRHLLKTKETTSENTDDDNKTGGRKSKKKKKEKKRKGCSGCKPCEIGEKRVHECTVCHKILRYCSEFKYHMNRHTREKKFTCAICKKSYHDQFYLHQHKRMHSEGNLLFLLPLSASCFCFLFLPSQ